MNPKMKGLILGICAAVSYGMNPVFALPLYAQGMKPASVLFYRFSVASAVLGILLLIMKVPLFRITWKEFGELAVFGSLFAVSSLSLYESFLYLDAGIACTILFTYPMMVAILSAAIFREKISYVVWFCIFLAFAGIALLYKGNPEAALSTKGILLVLLSALTYALYMVFLRRCKIREMDSAKMTFWILLTSLIFFSLKLKGFTELQRVPCTFSAFACIGGIVCLPTVVSIFCTNSAIQLIGATPTAILGALEPLTALAAGILLFHEQITLRIGFGIVMILAAVVFVIAEKCFRKN